MTWMSLFGKAVNAVGGSLPIILKIAEGISALISGQISFEK